MTSCTPVGVVSQGAKRGGNEGVKGVQSEGEWEWESVNIIAAMKKQPTHIMYILILMTEVYVFGCNSHLHTHSSATLGHAYACTHNMPTTRVKHKHTTNKHGPLPPHPPVVWHEKPHNYKVKRGSSGQRTLPELYLMLCSTEHTPHQRTMQTALATR